MAPNARGCSRWLVGVAALGAVVLSCGPVRAQIPEEAGESSPTINRPASIGRIARHFDFEERAFNAFDVPLYWIRAQHDPQVRQRPGFPITNLARLDYESPATSGIGTVRLDTHGGSTSLRLEPGVVPIFPSVRYAVGAMVRVQGLAHARPRLAARLLDADGRPIEGTEARAVLDRPQGGWPDGFMPVLVTLPPAPVQAVSVQIDLELVQPRELHQAEHDAFALWQEDYAGSVWFDDAVVVQLPTASLRTARPSNAFLADEHPELIASVRDLSGDPMGVELLVRDLDGVVVARRQEAFGMGERQISWRPELPALGWYEAELVVRAGRTPMLHLRERFAWLPPSEASMSVAATRQGMAPDRQAACALADRRRLGLVLPAAIAPGSQEGPMPQAAGELLDRSGARGLLVPVRLPIGPPAAPSASPASPAALPMAGAWGELARHVTAWQSLLGAQATVVLTVEHDDPHAGQGTPGEQAFARLADPQVWDDVLVGLIDRLAEAVRRWHIGPLGSEALAGTPANAHRLADVAERLDRLAPEPVVGVPWPGLFDPLGAPLPAGDHRWGLTILAPPAADGAWVAEVAQRLRGMLDDGRLAEATVVLQPLDEATYGRRAVVGRIAEAVLDFWETLPAIEPPQGQEVPESPIRLALAGAWRWGDEDSPTPTPTAALAAWRALSDRLAGMRRIDGFQTVEGVRATVYQPVVPGSQDDGGLLVLRPAPGRAGQTFELYLGELPLRVVDLFGNARMVDPVEVPEPFAQTPRLVHRIEIGDLPVFVDGVDTDLLMFIASLRLEPPLLPAIDAEHQAALVVRNPWPGVTSVRARVVWPGGFAGRPVAERSWEITPRLFDLLLEGGQERRTPLGIRFRRSESAGRKTLGLELDVRGENSARRIRVDVPFAIGLDYLEITATARHAPGGLLVSIEVRNVGQRPVTLEATAIAPGAGRQRAVIPRLPPGATARREVLLRGVDRSATDAVILAIEDVDVGARLNYRVQIP